MLNTIPGASGRTIYIWATVPIATMHFNATNMLLWTFITALNLYVAILICHRLCVAQKRTHTVLSHSLYKSIAIVMIECGALITLCSVAMLILYACNYVYALYSLGVATEVAVRLLFFSGLWIDCCIHRSRLNCFSLHGMRYRVSITTLPAHLQPRSRSTWRQQNPDMSVYP